MAARRSAAIVAAELKWSGGRTSASKIVQRDVVVLGGCTAARLDLADSSLDTVSYPKFASARLKSVRRNPLMSA
jgi:hypothetical protein